MATLPAYLNGLAGNGAFVVTANDYLARRDAELMGQVHRYGSRMYKRGRGGGEGGGERSALGSGLSVLGLWVCVCEECGLCLFRCVD